MYTKYLFIMYILVMYAVIFPDGTEEALVVYRFYESIGMFLCFFFGGLTCVGFRLVSGLGLLAIAIIVYYFCEAAQNIRNKREIMDVSCFEMKYSLRDNYSSVRNVSNTDEEGVHSLETSL